MIGHDARARGAALIIASALGFAVSSMIVRRAADDGLDTCAITFYVGCVRFVLCLLVVLARGDLRNKALCGGQGWAFLALCTVRQGIGAFSILAAFVAFARIPIGNATVLLFTSPVWTTCLAFCCLGERVTRTGQVAAVLVCLGVALVAHTSASGDATQAATEAVAANGGARASKGATTAVVGTVFALLASVSDACFYVATRAIGNRQDSVTLTMWMGFSIITTVGPLCMLVGVPLGSEHVERGTMLSLAAGGTASLLANVFFNLGLERLEAAPANVLGALQVPIGFVIQVLLGQPCSPVAVLGATVIVVCALAVTLTKPEPAAAAAREDGDAEDAFPLLGRAGTWTKVLAVDHLE
ncbi:hypothetical protein T492DRAFT_1030020 [Pavlovales sp. CCMP2436]|nr:hypothetical protein T492DRAFT_1030020 [Pavlovales sp. CCMP2436]|mmetsp:Transcript_3900/g.9886  ORF Transcript_3900/g.9886 Transcript_3900/m.9886 type:complete len:356 (+) Transcript_3900:121-1188(+)